MIHCTPSLWWCIKVLCFHELIQVWVKWSRAGILEWMVIFLFSIFIYEIRLLWFSLRWWTVCRYESWRQEKAYHSSFYGVCTCLISLDIFFVSRFNWSIVINNKGVFKHFPLLAGMEISQFLKYLEIHGLFLMSSWWKSNNLFSTLACYYWCTID